MDRDVRLSSFFAWVGWLVLSLFLNFGPDNLLSTAQSTVQASAGRLLGAFARGESDGRLGHDPTTGHTQTPGTSPNTRLIAENRALVEQLAQMQSQIAEFKLDQQRPYSLGSELLESTLLKAKILGRKGDPLSLKFQLLINLGQRQGLTNSDLVLNGEGFLIDRGSELGMSADQIVVAGRSLLGRTTKVGRETALVQPLTDPLFRIAVRIVRPSHLGPIEGPPGILVGTGDACRIENVNATEAVAVGDTVYTDPKTSGSSVRIYCGQIVQAEAQPAANHWTLIMKPASNINSLAEEVSVLKTTLHLNH